MLNHISSNYAAKKLRISTKKITRDYVLEYGEDLLFLGFFNDFGLTGTV